MCFCSLESSSAVHVHTRGVVVVWYMMGEQQRGSWSFLCSLSLSLCLSAVWGRLWYRDVVWGWGDCSMLPLQQINSPCKDVNLFLSSVEEREGEGGKPYRAPLPFGCIFHKHQPLDFIVWSCLTSVTCYTSCIHLCFDVFKKYTVR